MRRTSFAQLFCRILRSHVKALLHQGNRLFAKWARVQPPGARRTHSAMSARDQDYIDAARAADLALVTWARVAFLVAIRVLKVKLHIANEVLERLAAFLERNSPRTIFGVLFDDLGVEFIFVAPHGKDAAMGLFEPNGKFVETAAVRRRPQPKDPRAIASVTIGDR